MGFPEEDNFCCYIYIFSVKNEIKWFLYILVHTKMRENANSRNPRLLRTSYHRQILIEYQRMNQVATEYERKHVYRIECNDCSSVLTDRGMNVSIYIYIVKHTVKYN